LSTCETIDDCPLTKHRTIERQKIYGKKAYILLLITSSFVKELLNSSSKCNSSELA